MAERQTSGTLAKEAILAGPRVLGQRPLSFLAWALVRLAEQYVTLAILLGARLAGAVAGVGPAWAVLASLPFEAALVAAVLRAQLKPQAKAFAFLRLGLVESRMAGLLILGFLAGAAIALPASIGVAYLGLAVRQRLVAEAALGVGALAAALALMRFAPAPAILVDGNKVDLPLAWRASRSGYGVLSAVVIGAAIFERLLGPALPGLVAAPVLTGWSALWAPMRLLGLVWRSLIGVAILTVMAGAVATVWRRHRQTLS